MDQMYLPQRLVAGHHTLSVRHRPSTELFVDFLSPFSLDDWALDGGGWTSRQPIHRW